MYWPRKLSLNFSENSARRDGDGCVQVEALFAQLVRTSRWRIFTMSEVCALGVPLHMRKRQVDRLLNELVEQDGIVFRVAGLPEHYAFISPRARRLAA